MVRGLRRGPQGHTETNVRIQRHRKKPKSASSCAVIVTNAHMRENKNIPSHVRANVHALLPAVVLSDKH